MEDREFDELTKSLARPVSRRTVLKATLASVAGGVGAMAIFGRARAQNTLACHGAGTPCAVPGSDNECCTGYCSPTNRRCGCPNGQPPTITTTRCTSPGQTGCCPAGFPSCEICGCPSGTFLCNGACLPTGTTLCGSICCGANQVCAGSGVCEKACTSTSPCPAGTRCVSGGCAKICTSSLPCPAGQTCMFNSFCCPNSQVCVFGEVCCPPGSPCVNNSCVGATQP